ncbi:hypothetical protein K503DRAFT_767430 [Rhizopogon vinicolor AM-OR11-026]|uniref:Uncharacterized protein n=1 Tax=Rhizopogon vinicolor AM-OR11-026 TaxID=1314800 RepID=A0A1B7NA11_9AGAM|nr:hypothetical protein K503DRAFT_767430 [Rhizopogon vinicolor AM-OR11-026]
MSSERLSAPACEVHLPTGEPSANISKNKFFEIHFDVVYDRRSDVSAGLGQKRVALPDLEAQVLTKK